MTRGAHDDLVEPVPPEAAALVVRVWREGAAPAGFRARTTWTPDLAGRESGTSVSSDPGAVVEVVLAWLASFQEAWERAERTGGGG